MRKERNTSFGETGCFRPAGLGARRVAVPQVSRHWSNGTGTAGRQSFWFQPGTGFGNTSQATEHVLVDNGKYHKLGRVHFDLDRTWSWRLYDDEGRLDLTLTPALMTAPPA
ncbi:MAG: DUF2804 family protein [Ruthenibacterium lactatiformans]